MLFRSLSSSFVDGLCAHSCNIHPLQLSFMHRYTTVQCHHHKHGKLVLGPNKTSTSKHHFFKIQIIYVPCLLRTLYIYTHICTFSHLFTHFTLKSYGWNYNVFVRSIRSHTKWSKMYSLIFKSHFVIGILCLQQATLISILLQFCLHASLLHVPLHLVSYCISWKSVAISLNFNWNVPYTFVYDERHIIRRIFPEINYYIIFKFKEHGSKNWFLQM